MRPSLFTLLLFCLFAVPFQLFAQLEIPLDFQAKLAEIKADIFRPLDSDFKAQRIDTENLVPAQFAMRSKQEKLEIRYYVRSEQDMRHFAGMPHVDAGRLVMNAASNAEDNVTSVHSFGAEELETFGADWAKMFTFRPKQSFSPTKHAQMVALYREKQGMIYIFLLFDKAPETLDARQIAARFIN